ncbi:MAG TPA: ATP-binding protein [Solirubrobacteraceae bacterium]|jgi:anti-sigma regulatory factor (Ser/Thr protein kinase)|nr:ATP-binding protein [Solirubrobacteraceae bacterium]
MANRSKGARAGGRARHGAPATRGAGNGPARVELELERSVQAPALARAAITERCEQLGIGGSLAQSLILLVSEVVSNAVRHSSGDPKASISLLATFGERMIRVSVVDPGEGFTPRPRDPSRTHDGYGLYLLEKVSARWGVESQGQTKVWFELARV